MKPDVELQDLTLTPNSSVCCQQNVATGDVGLLSTLSCMTHQGVQGQVFFLGVFMPCFGARVRVLHSNTEVG